MSPLQDLGATLAIVTFVLVLVAYIQHLARRGVYRLPPGPKGLPILGNIHQLPAKYQHETFTKWAAEYGDVFYIQICHKPAIVVNTLQAAHDLMEKRSSLYSDRPKSVVMGFEFETSILPYGKQWRLHRKWFQTAFQTKTAQLRHRPLQLRAVRQLLSALLDSPADFRNNIQRFAGAMMLEIAYGHTATSADDDFIGWVGDTIARVLESGGGGATVIDLFPICERDYDLYTGGAPSKIVSFHEVKHVPDWMPGAGSKRRAAAMRPAVREFHDLPYNRVKAALDAGCAKTSFLSSLIERASANSALTEEDEFNLKGAAGMVYIGEHPTFTQQILQKVTNFTVTVLLTFIIAMVLHPEVYKKAQAEIDRVVGHSRLPNHEDLPSTPYLSCVLKEVYRWRCPLPLAVPHQVIKDDEYLGYHIPAGSMIIPNVWAMTRNPDLYPDPDNFMPERFENLDAETASRLDPTKLVFGFGRRICSGRSFANSNMLLLIANILATMNIRKARDEAGKEITPDSVFMDGGVCHPKPFKCDIQPRSQRAVEMIALANVESSY
ncbi:uncharacterized protein FIBRA_03048 [Fibroporia radiculosa]|uniref:Cytochrome P450 n=1 Tax=Fibroporia radiculosa TaxID=599839 RepID=J4GN95_9APHY|nr:uncharacterized protein FIBRA_03048 [Fibroporia radiculosa]CCM01000.1 predicted protein [Fibroporia radiculosa]